MFSELEMLLVIVAGTGVLGMRGEEIQRHVAPIVALLRVPLKNRHQLDNRDSEIFQIWDLFHQARISSRPRWIYAGVGILREAFDVQFVNDCIRLVMQRTVSCPVKNWTVSSQYAQGCAACICSFSHCQSAIELRWDLGPHGVLSAAAHHLPSQPS